MQEKIILKTIIVASILYSSLFFIHNTSAYSYSYSVRPASAVSNLFNFLFGQATKQEQERIKTDNKKDDEEKVEKTTEELLEEIQEWTKAAKIKQKQYSPYPGHPDTGIAGSKNFTVLAPSGDFLARDVLLKAEEFKKAIALEWLGREIPKGKEFTHINVSLSCPDSKTGEIIDEGSIMLCGKSRGFGSDHRMWLETTREYATGSTLKHEVAHIVIASLAPRFIPSWIMEGVASRYDDKVRVARRNEIVRHFIDKNLWPHVTSVVVADHIAHDNERAYTVAASLVDFFVAKKGKKVFGEFLQETAKNGQDVALAKYYNTNTQELQRQWQDWVTKQYSRSKSN